MKIKLLTILLGILVSGTINLSAQNVERAVSEIRTEVTAINKSAKSYAKKTKNVEGVSLEGTEATYFTSGRGLKKITAKFYGESFQATGEYYFQGEELIFAYEKTSKYNGTIGMKNLKVVKVEEKRFYFSAGKMIKLLVGKTSVKSGSEDWQQAESEMLDLVKTLKDAY